MTLDDFLDRSCGGGRFPSPAEWVAVVRGQGWRFVLDGDAAALCGTNGDDMAVAVARLFRCEPLRTNLLAHLRSEPTTPFAPAVEEVPPAAVYDQAAANRLMEASDALVERLGVPGTHPDVAFAATLVCEANARRDIDGVRRACSEMDAAARKLSAERQFKPVPS